MGCSTAANSFEVLDSVRILGFSIKGPLLLSFFLINSPIRALRSCQQPLSELQIYPFAKMKLTHFAPLLLLPTSVVGLAVLPESVEISNVATSDSAGKDLIVLGDDNSYVIASLGPAIAYIVERLQLQKRQVRAFTVGLVTGGIRVLGNLSFQIISYSAGVLVTELANKIAEPYVAEIYEEGRLLWREVIQGHTCHRRVTVECKEPRVELRLVPT